jgi:phosphoserine phosphatase
LARKAASSPNGHDRLEEAMAMLIQNQASFVGRLAENDRRHLEFERETAERFARIEAQMAEIIRVLHEHGRILAEHGRLLEHLPEAVREKIGFKSPS